MERKALIFKTQYLKRFQQHGGRMNLFDLTFDTQDFR